jgi:hypothetical protein
MEVSMAISREDALSALAEVQAAEARALVSRSHRVGAPHLFVWGAVWIVGYTATGLLPSGAQIGWMWMIVGTAGGIASMLLSRREADRAKRPAAGGSFAFLAVAAFVAGTYWVMRPTSSLQYDVFPPMLVSLIYMIAGGWRGTRLMWVGMALFVLSMLGYAFLKPVLPFYLAVVGGGGLILGGLWMRSA